MVRRELELPVGARGQRADGDYRVGVERTVDVRERDIGAWHVFMADLGAHPAGVDDQEHEVIRRIPVERVSHPGDLGSLRGVDEPLLGQGPAGRRRRVHPVTSCLFPVGARGNVVDPAHLSQRTPGNAGPVRLSYGRTLLFVGLASPKTTPWPTR